MFDFTFYPLLETVRVTQNRVTRKAAGQHTVLEFLSVLTHCVLYVPFRTLGCDGKIIVYSVRYMSVVPVRCLTLSDVKIGLHYSFSYEKVFLCHFYLRPKLLNDN